MSRSVLPEFLYIYNKNIMNTTGIYKITNPNNLIYIGCSVNLENRYNQYKGMQVKNQPQIYNSLIEYGFKNHTFEIIEECDETLLEERERYWIKHYNSYFNGLNGNRGGVGVLHHTEKTKEKIRNSKIGWLPSPERGIKIGKQIMGRKYSKEHKEKISKALKGKPKPFKGRVSPNKGNEYSPEVRDKMSKIKQGFIYSEDTKRKMSESQWKKREINQYDLEDNFLKQWSSITEAKRFIGSGDIGACVRGKQKTAGGFKWKFA